MSHPNGQHTCNMGNLRHQQGASASTGNYYYATQARRSNEFMRPAQWQFMQNQPMGGRIPSISQTYHSQTNYNFYFEHGGTYEINLNLNGNCLPSQVQQPRPAFNSSPIPAGQPGGCMGNRDASNLSSALSSIHSNPVPLETPPPPYQQQTGERQPVVPVPLHPGRMGQNDGPGPSSAFAEYRVRSSDDSFQSLLNQSHGILDASNTDEERSPLTNLQSGCSHCAVYEPGVYRWAPCNFK